jgi:hypothetical protein
MALSLVLEAPLADLLLLLLKLAVLTPTAESAAVLYRA